MALLDSVPGKKLLLLEEATSEALELVVTLPVLYEHGVGEQGGIKFVSKTDAVDKAFNNVLVLITPSMASLRCLVEIFRKSQDRASKHNYVVALWPRRNALVKEYLQSVGVLDHFELRDFSFDLLPLENDLFSLELKCFRQIYVENDYSYFSYVAESIHRLQAIFGRIGNFYAKGHCAKVVLDILRQKEHEIRVEEAFGDIESMVILDRSIDFVTPLLKQLVYEGLIDEVFGITGVITKIPVRVFDEKERD